MIAFQHLMRQFITTQTNNLRANEHLSFEGIVVYKTFNSKHCQTVEHHRIRFYIRWPLPPRALCQLGPIHYQGNCQGSNSLLGLEQVEIMATRFPARSSSSKSIRDTSTFHRTDLKLEGRKRVRKICNQCMRAGGLQTSGSHLYIRDGFEKLRAFA